MARLISFVLVLVLISSSDGGGGDGDGGGGISESSLGWSQAYGWSRPPLFLHSPSAGGGFRVVTKDFLVLIPRDGDFSSSSLGGLELAGLGFTFEAVVYGGDGVWSDSTKISYDEVSGGPSHGSGICCLEEPAYALVFSTVNVVGSGVKGVSRQGVLVAGGKIEVVDGDLDWRDGS